MAETEVLTPSGLKEFTKPQAQQSQGMDIAKVLKEANGFVTNLKSLFEMGDRFKGIAEGETPQGNIHNKFEKGVETGRNLESSKPIKVELIVDSDGAMEKIKKYIESVFAMVDDKETAEELKKKVKEQLEGGDKDLIKEMVADFIRSYATARAV